MLLASEILQWEGSRNFIIRWKLRRERFSNLSPVHYVLDITSVFTGAFLSPPLLLPPGLAMLQYTGHIKALTPQLSRPGCYVFDTPAQAVPLSGMFLPCFFLRGFYSPFNLMPEVTTSYERSLFLRPHPAGLSSSMFW